MKSNGVAWQLTSFVEPTDLLEDAGGREAVIKNIIYLHDHLLGEKLEENDAEIQRTLALFEGVYADGHDDLLSEDPNYPVALPSDCRATTDRITGDDLGAAALTDDPDYTVRAWMAVVSYLLGDFAFLYE